MNKKPNVRPTPAPPVVPPAPVWQRLDLPADCTSFQTNQFKNHGGLIVTYGASQSDYGMGYVNIFPPVGNWQEQTWNEARKTYINTALKITVTQAQTAANVPPMSLTLDGGVGPQKLMRYLKL